MRAPSTPNIGGICGNGMGGARSIASNRAVKRIVMLWGDNKCSDLLHRATGTLGACVVEILLHLGAHRTGTTGLQVLLNSQRPALKRAGVAYWGPERTRNGLLAGVVKDPTRLTDNDDRLAARSRGRLRMEFSRLEQSGVQQLVISEENLLGTMAQNLSATRLYDQAAARLLRIAPAFEGRPLRIGLSVRAYDMHWASQLAFRVKVGAALPSKDDLDRLVTQPRRWRNVIADVGTAFPQAEIKVWSFEGCVAMPAALITAFLGRHIPFGSMPKPHKSNASANATDLANLAAERGDLDGALRLASMGQGARYTPFDTDQKWKLHQDYRADIAWLEAGANDPRVTYLTPTEGTFGGGDMTEGSHYDRPEKSVGSAR